MAVVYRQVSDFACFVGDAGFFLFACCASVILFLKHFVVVVNGETEQVFEVVFLFVFCAQFPVRH